MTADVGELRVRQFPEGWAGPLEEFLLDGLANLRPLGPQIGDDPNEVAGRGSQVLQR